MLIFWFALEIVEMIAYRTEFTLVPELRRLLDSDCEIPDCSHVSPEWTRRPPRSLDSHRRSQTVGSMKTVGSTAP